MPRTKPSYTIVADNPKTGAQIIQAEVPEKDAPRAAKKLKKAGMKDVKVVATPDPRGNTG